MSPRSLLPLFWAHAHGCRLCTSLEIKTGEMVDWLSIALQDVLEGELTFRTGLTGSHCEQTLAGTTQQTFVLWHVHWWLQKAYLKASLLQCKHQMHEFNAHSMPTTSCTKGPHTGLLTTECRQNIGMMNISIRLAQGVMQHKAFASFPVCTCAAMRHHSPCTDNHT